MTLFSISRSLGLPVSVRPMLDPNDGLLNRIDEYQGEGEGQVFRIGDKFRETAVV
jgi:hypothetical protein